MEVPLLQAVLLLGASIVAGICWNTLGIWQKYKEEGLKTIDWLKVRKNVIIGIVLGVIAYSLTITDVIPVDPIVGLNSFILAVIAFFPFIVIAERIFTRRQETASVTV